MKKTFLNILKSSLFCFLLVGLISCNNIFSDYDLSQKTSNEKTTLKISLQETELMRTLCPSSDISILSNFVIRGKKTGSSDNPTQLATASDKTELRAVVIEFDDADVGSWDLTLTGNLMVGASTISFSDTQTVTITKNKLNSVSFKVKTQDIDYGGLNIKVSFSGSTNKIVATLQNEAKTSDIYTKTFETADFVTSEDERYIIFTRDIANSSEKLTSGTYYLLFSFYDTTLSTEIPLNTLPNYVRIINGLTTTADLSISLNEVYTITYVDNDGTIASGVKTEKYSRKSTVNLPVMEKDGYIFAGWYESSDFTGTPVTKIEKGSTGNKTFYARFVSSTLYVSQTGDDSKDGMSPSTALASINKAIETIISYGNLSEDYTVKISGTIFGGQTISSSLTSEMASSITLEGVTGKTEDTWIDVLDGEFTESSKGTTLAIKTSVPVILQNLKITGGYQSGGNGGGIELYGGASLTMETGEISGNIGNSSGQGSAGGVFLHHGSSSWNGSFSTIIVPGAVFTMNDGTICNNTGNGVTLYDGSAPGTFNMNGGTITGNSGYGVEMVYSTGSFGQFNIKGSAVVAANNKVYLGYPGGTKIYISGELTEAKPVATISLNGYSENTEIITLANGVTDTSILSAACAKIEIAPNNDISWYLTSEGKLTSTNPNSSTDTLTYIDLGLPSGTLWANMNVGATSITDVGTHFEWMDGGVDLAQLSSGDIMPSANDMATINSGADWCMPTKEQFEELYSYCYFEPVTSYKGVDVSGYVVFKAKDETHTDILTGCGLYNINAYKRDGYDVDTDPHIFIPAESDDVYLWSSTYGGDAFGGRDQIAYCLFFVDQYEPIETEIIKTTTTDDWEKHPVRAVSKEKKDFVFVEGASITTPPQSYYGGGAFAYASTSNPVTVPSFYMCKHEVTQEEYEKYCCYGSTSPDETNNKDEYPAYYISWYDAIVYCNRRSIDEGLQPVYSIKVAIEGSNEKTDDPTNWDGVISEGSKYRGPDERTSSWEWVSASPGFESIDVSPTANGYRLPSREEWEYAARGGNGLSGTQTEFSGSSEYTDVAFDDSDIHRIQLKKANTLGIYDMSGSVSEWLFDVYNEDYRGMANNSEDGIDYTYGATPYDRSYGDGRQGLRVIHY